jgi:hypothetical protein
MQNKNSKKPYFKKPDKIIVQHNRGNRIKCLSAIIIKDQCVYARMNDQVNDEKKSG